MNVSQWIHVVTISMVLIVDTKLYLMVTTLTTLLTDVFIMHMMVIAMIMGQ